MVFYSQEMSSWLLVAGCAVNAEPFLFFVVRPDLNSSSKSLPLWGRCPEGRRGNAAVEGSHYRGFPRPPVLEGHPINTKRSRPKAVIGKVEGVLFVVFVENEDELGTSTRIISARAADEEEVAAYFEELMY